MTQMCNVNYLTEIRRFNTFAARTRLPASAQLLWYKLIEIMNQHARGGDWCNGFLRIDNPYLLAYFPMSATALADARRTLCESGLLEYIPGEKKRTPPAYRLHYFSVCDGKGAIERDYPREIALTAQPIAPLMTPKSVTIPVLIPIFLLMITLIAPKSVTIPVTIRITQAFTQAIAQPFVQPIAQAIATEIRPIFTTLI